MRPAGILPFSVCAGNFVESLKKGGSGEQEGDDKRINRKVCLESFECCLSSCFENFSLIDPITRRLAYEEGSDEEEADDEEYDYYSEEDDEEAAEMPPRRVPPPARVPVPPGPPPAAVPAAPAPGGVDGLAAAMANTTLSMPPPYKPFDFSFRAPVIFTHTTSLAEGHKVVYGDYLVPTVHVSRYKMDVVHGGEVAALGMNITDVL